MLPSRMYYNTAEIEKSSKSSITNFGGLHFGKLVGDLMKAKIASKMLRLDEHYGTSPFVRIVSGIYHKDKPDVMFAITNGNVISDTKYHPDFNYRPTGGISNFSIQTGGQSVAVRKGKLVWHCNSVVEFNYLSRFFLVPGLYVLVEWGTAKGAEYCINYRKFINKKSGSDPTTQSEMVKSYKATLKDKKIEEYAKLENELKGDNLFTVIGQTISQNEIKSWYEYDGMIGTVYNFETNYKTDGTVETTINIMEQNRHSLWLESAEPQYVYDTSVKSEDDKKEDKNHVEAHPVKRVLNIMTNDDKGGSKLYTMALSSVNAAKKGVKGEYYIPGKCYAIMDTPPISTKAGETENTTKSIYINIYLLEAIINKVYNNESDIDISGSKNSDANSIRWNSWCKSCSWVKGGIKSNDLSVCIFPTKKIKDSTGECWPMTLPSPDLEIRKEEEPPSDPPGNLDSSAAYIGRIMVKVDFIKSCFSGGKNISSCMEKIAAGISRASSGLIDLMVYPTKILSANVSFGFQDIGYIELKTKNAPKDDRKKMFRFEVLNGNSVVKNVSFNTKFSEQYAAQVIFEAGKRENSVAISKNPKEDSKKIDITKEAMLFSFDDQVLDGDGILGKLNSSFYDRFKPDKINVTLNKEVKLNKEISKTLTQENEHYQKYIVDYLARLSASKEYIAKMNDTDSEEFKYEKQCAIIDFGPISNEKNSTYSVNFKTEFWWPMRWTKDIILKENMGISVTPVKLDVELDGMSGWHLGMLINLDSLPKSFAQGMFIVNSVNHDINGGVWTTKLSSVYRPMVFSSNNKGILKLDVPIVYSDKQLLKKTTSTNNPVKKVETEKKVEVQKEKKQKVSDGWYAKDDSALGGVIEVTDTNGEVIKGTITKTPIKVTRAMGLKLSKIFAQLTEKEYKIANDDSVTEDNFYKALNSGWRDKIDQNVLKSSGNKSVSKGWSPHNGGYAIDIDDSFYNYSEFKQLKQYTRPDSVDKDPNAKIFWDVMTSNGFKCLGFLKNKTPEYWHWECDELRIPKKS